MIWPPGANSPISSPLWASLKFTWSWPFVAIVDESLHRRNLFDGLDIAPQIAADHILLVADRAEAKAGPPGLIWLSAVGLDRSTAYRGITVCRDLHSAREMAGGIGGAAFYAPVTERFS